MTPGTTSMSTSVNSFPSAAAARPYRILPRRRCTPVPQFCPAPPLPAPSGSAQFPRASRWHRFLCRKLRRSQRHIGRIAAQNVRRFQGCAGLQRQVNAVAGTEAHNIYLMSHRIAISNLAPRAPQPVPSSHRQWFPCGAEVFLRCAAPHCARIHCLLPTVRATKAEAVNVPSTAPRAAAL